jgi:hypothetical protein
LIVLSAVIWCTITNRWSTEAWRTPLEYIDNPESIGDALFYFTEVKAAKDNYYWPILEKKYPQLGAPGVAVWGDYPTTEEMIIFITGLFARVVGIFAACNLMVMMAQILAALSMYSVCRLLGCHWTWSFVAGIIFGFASYAFAQSEHHLDLTFYWHIPLCLLVTRCLSVGQGLSFKNPKFVFGLLLGFVTGLQNQYYTFLFIQLALLGGIAQWLRNGWERFWPAVAICLSSVLGFLIITADSIIFQFLHGTNPNAVLRNYSQMEFYALKIVSWFIPFSGHRLFSPFGDWYSRNVLVRGEVPHFAYFGIIGIIGLLWLGADTFKRMVKDSAPMSLEAAQVIWIVLLGSVGGLNALFGVFGFYLFRATGRYSIFVLALVLMFTAQRLTQLTKHRPVWICAGSAALLTLLALFDQTPPLTTRAQIEQTVDEVNSDAKFTAEIESRLPRGAMLFQLPLVDFPEGFVGPCYNHFRPFLFSRELRFSFGAVRGRRNDEWVNTLSAGSAEQAVRILKEHGFSAIYVDRFLNPLQSPGQVLRKEYYDTQQRLYEGFTTMGLKIIDSPRGDLFCVILNQ